MASPSPTIPATRLRSLARAPPHHEPAPGVDPSHLSSARRALCPLSVEERSERSEVRAQPPGGDPRLVDTFRVLAESDDRVVRHELDRGTGDRGPDDVERGRLFGEPREVVQLELHLLRERQRHRVAVRHRSALPSLDGDLHETLLCAHPTLRLHLRPHAVGSEVPREHIVLQPRAEDLVETLTQGRIEHRNGHFDASLEVPRHADPRSR